MSRFASLRARAEQFTPLGEPLQDAFSPSQSDIKIPASVGIVGLDFQGLLVMGDGLVEPSATGQSDTEVVVGLGVVGLDFQGLLVMGDGLVDLSAAARAQPRLLWASA